MGIGLMGLFGFPLVVPGADMAAETYLRSPLFEIDFESNFVAYYSRLPQNLDSHLGPELDLLGKDKHS